MRGTVTQQALERVLAYLHDEGRELDAETLRRASGLVDKALAYGDGADLPARCIDLVPEYFAEQTGGMPALSLPLERGHIGYYPND